MKIARTTTTTTIERTPSLLDRLIDLDQRISPLWSEAGELIDAYLATQATAEIPASFIEQNFWSQVKGQRNRLSAVRHIIENGTYLTET